MTDPANAIGENLIRRAEERQGADRLHVVSVTRTWGNVYRIVTESAKYDRVVQTVLLLPRAVADAERGPPLSDGEPQ